MNESGRDYKRFKILRKLRSLDAFPPRHEGDSGRLNKRFQMTKCECFLAKFHNLLAILGRLSQHHCLPRAARAEPSLVASTSNQATGRLFARLKIHGVVL